MSSIPDHTASTASDGQASLSVSALIRHSLGALTRREKQVAQVLLAGPPSVGLGTSTQLAAVAGVSPPTVSRFVAHLGFRDYGSFQQALHDDLDRRLQSPVAAIGARAGKPLPDDLASATVAAIEAGVDATLRSLSADDLRKGGERLAGARRVAATGGRFSHSLARYLSHALRELRPDVELVERTAEARAAAIAATRARDVLVCFDFRRYERRTYELADAFKRAGAGVVLFTDPWLSPIVTLGDIVFSAVVETPSPLDTLTPTLATVEAVLASTITALGDRGVRHLQQFNSIADDWLFEAD